LIRITPDTNVLVSAFFYNGNERAIVEAAIQGKLRFVLSTEILDELIKVLDKKFGVDLEVTRDYVLRLNEVTDIVTPRKLFNVPVRDREDAKIIECAHFGDSNYIVTGDRDLLSLKRYKRTRILSPSKVIKILGHEKPTA
jgi:putative PIN family toxin of toxin-antitoxin system